MSWQQISAMGAGANPSNGIGGSGQDLAGAGGQHAGGAGHPSNGPQATEYTLQGVMRFLQTEWHKHERDRNAWEIERQEMKGRIAALEGSARRADATQKALKRYVNILEKKVKEQATHLKTASVHSADSDDHSVKLPPRFDRAAIVQEQLKRSDDRPKETIPGLEGVLDRTQEEDEREHLRAFLDQCQAEFTYLMITPANPMPPRESPPLPVIEDLREGDQFGMPNSQQALEAAFQGMRIGQGGHPRDPSAASRNPAMNHNVSLPTGMPAQNPSQSATRANSELQSAMMMRSGDSMQPNTYPQSGDWQAVAGNARLQPQNDDAARAAAAQLSNEVGNQNDRGTEVLLQQPPRKQAERRANDTDGWDFNEAAFPDAAPPQQSVEPQTASHRPDTDIFPAADGIPKSPTRGQTSHRRKNSMSRRRSADQDSLNAMAQKADAGSFKLRYGLRGHLNTVRTVIFSGGGSPGEPEICTAGDDGLVKRFHLPRESSHLGTSTSSDLDVTADFTHRGHNGAVLCLTSWTPSPNFSTGGRAQGDGWIFSGGQDATIRVWERGRVDPKATLEGHTDAVWAITVLPATLGAVFGSTEQYSGQGDRILIVSGSADGTVKIWAVSAPPQLSSPQPGSAGGRRGTAGGRVRGNSMSSGSQFPNSPQPSMASNSQFNYTLVHDLRRADGSTASPTSITPLASNGEKFVVSYSDAAIIVFDTKSGDEVGSMASRETYDGTIATSVNAVQATITSLDSNSTAGMGEEDAGGPTGGTGTSGSGVEGVIISGHEDRFISLFDANSGQCTYTMLAHPDAISSLSLSPDGRELVSAGHDASLRFWSLEKRNCVQEMTVHRIMRGEGVCSVVWSQDGRWVVSGGGDGLVKVFAR